MTDNKVSLTMYSNNDTCMLSQFIVISLYQESVTSLHTVENRDQVILCNYS